MKRSKLLVLVSATLLITQLAAAGQQVTPLDRKGGVGGGGGSTVPKPKVVQAPVAEPRELVDLHHERQSNERFVISGRLKEDLRDFSKYVHSILGLDLDSTIVNEISAVDAPIFLTNRLPPCPPRKTTEDEKVFGCTPDQNTYLLRSEFLSPSMRNPATRALAVIHERLHAFNINATEEQVHGFVKSAKIYFQVRDRQKTGDYSPLTDEEVYELSAIRTRAEELGAEVKNGNVFEIEPKGGGVLTGKFYLKDSYLSIDSGAHCQKFCSIIDSKLVEGSFINDGQLSQSVLTRSTAGSMYFDPPSDVTRIFYSILTDTHVNRGSTVTKQNLSKCNFTNTRSQYGSGSQQYNDIFVIGNTLCAKSERP
jgi:hypothetical protein